MVRDIIRLMEIFSFIYAFAAVYGEKVKYNIYLVVFGVTELVLLSGINDYGLGTYWLSLSYLLMFIYCLANYRSSVKTTVVKCTIGYAVVAICQIVSYMIISLIVELGNFAVPQKEIIVSLIYTVVIVSFAKKMHLYELSQFFLKRNKLLSGVGIFILVILGSQIWSIKRNYRLDAKIVVLTVCFISLLIIMVYEWDKTRKDAEYRKMQLEMNKLYYEAYERLIQSIRERQHDFKNHLNALEGMIYSIDNYDELVLEQKKYLQSIMGELEPARLLTLVENPLIAGFLNYKVSKAQEMGITTRYHCVLQKRDMGIPEFKLIEMMGILLDNAIEELSSESIADRVLVIELMVEDNIMKFAVSHSYENNNNLDVSKIFENGYSSKGNGRGIGLSKLKHMMKDNNGEIAVSQEVFENVPVLKIEWLISI